MRPAPFKNAPPPSFMDEDRSFRSRHPYLLCFLVVLVILLVVLGILVLIFYFLYRPQQIVFKVAKATLTKVLVEPGATPQTLGMSGLVVVTASIRNPNRFDFTYNNVTGNLTFSEDQQLALGSVLEGRVRKQSTKLLDVNLELNTRGGGPKAAELSRAIGVDGVVNSNFRTTVTGTVKFFVLKRNYRATISCNMTITVTPSPGLNWECSEIKI
ncbi:hypothetical protein CBR_g4514 [Chara braunii]|uniref:Late embryogenesis abundant protein LEA-2 subgroup domain-containing protein n=1 Tax=Chara braunii TaxID=69332 RepID=A0A388KHZ3_CHABU|nr:hypothetical protein CBR_g4514 [Chara braunii]|eukprot:GBG69684.1 hypothetical protein CBR_g4514 [Chara braunii]